MIVAAQVQIGWNRQEARRSIKTVDIRTLAKKVESYVGIDRKLEGALRRKRYQIRSGYPSDKKLE